MRQTPAPAQTPAPRAGTSVVVDQSKPAAFATVLTRSEIVALAARRSELSGLLTAAQARRDRLAHQLLTAVGDADRSGIQARISQLDKRLLQLDGEIDDIGRQLASAPAALVTSTALPPPRFSGGPSPGQLTAIAIVGTVFVLAPLALAYARLIWRRASNPNTALPASREITARLDHMAQGLDAIAIEVERISEGQRFVTQFLGEKRPRALGVGQAPAE